MDEATTRVTVDTQVPGYWRITLNRPPINTVDDLILMSREKADELGLVTMGTAGGAGTLIQRV